MKLKRLADLDSATSAGWIDENPRGNSHVGTANFQWHPRWHGILLNEDEAPSNKSGRVFSGISLLGDSTLTTQIIVLTTAAASLAKAELPEAMRLRALPNLFGKRID